MSEKIWAPSNTGVLAHAFTRTKRADLGALPMLVAACRSSITREAGAVLYRAEDMHRLCGPCVKATERDAEYRARTAYYAGLAEQQDAVMSQAEAVKPLSTGMVNALTGARPGLGNPVLDNSVRTGTCVALIERGLVTDLTTGKGAHVLTDEGFRVRGELLAAEGQRIEAAVDNTEPVEAEAQVAAESAAEQVAEVEAQLPDAIETASLGELEESEAWLTQRLAEVQAKIVELRTKAPIDAATGWPIFTIGDRGRRYAVSPRIQGPFGGVDSVKYFCVDYATVADRRRAWRNDRKGTLQRALWDARYAYDCNA